jgi:hypothetical protein
VVVLPGISSQGKSLAAAARQQQQQQGLTQDVVQGGLAAALMNRQLRMC